VALAPSFGPFALAVIAVVYSMVLPHVFAGRTSWRRTPVAMMLLWQSLELGGVLSAIFGGLLALWAWLDPNTTGWEEAGSLVAGALALLVLLRLIFSGHLVGRRLRIIRTRHRELVDLLGMPRSQADQSQIRVINAGNPVAYCLPSWRGSRIVVASSTLEQLDEPQLQAILAHERAHLAARHDLVVEGFAVLNRAFPQIRSGALAQREVEVLVEILADRAACKVVSPRQLLGAMQEMSAANADSSNTNTSGMAVATSAIPERISSMLMQPEPVRLQGVLLISLAVLVLLLPSVLFWVALLS
jgi:Zn-dependent protease with chaperone function